MQNEAPDVFVSWSGGKDCSQSCCLAMKQGMRVRCLLNMVTPDGERAWTHGQSAKIIALQAEAMGISIIQVPTSLDEYDFNFRKTVISLAAKGLTGGVFGTIDVPEHREWSRDICAGTGITPYLPLWEKPQIDIRI
jgi:diphthine-ammonia ligase